jgi:ammonia channel protein AmtB
MEILPKKGDITYRSMIIMKCFICGLVSVSAACSTCETYGAATIGVVAALLCIWISRIHRSLGIDAGEMAVSVHLVGGAWGVLAPGLLASQVGYESTYAGTYSVMDQNSPTSNPNCNPYSYSNPNSNLHSNPNPNSDSNF